MIFSPKAGSKTYVVGLGMVGEAISKFDMEITCKNSTPVTFVENNEGNCTECPSGDCSNCESSPNILLTMRTPTNMHVTVMMGSDKVLGTKDSWSGNFNMARTGEEYEYKVPIPKAAWIGKRIFELAVGPSGAITKIGYTKDTGAGQAIGVGQHVLETFGPAERLAALRLEADIIAAQQRLVTCHANPTDC